MEAWLQCTAVKNTEQAGCGGTHTAVIPAPWEAEAEGPQVLV